MTAGELRLLEGFADPVEAAPAGPGESWAVGRKYICFGEALRAITDYARLDMAAPPSAEMLDLLDTAYDCMLQSRPGFSPEEYALFTFSLALDCCDRETDRQALRLGASRYLIDKAARLSADFSGLAPRARALVAEAQPTPLPHHVRPEGRGLPYLREAGDTPRVERDRVKTDLPGRNEAMARATRSSRRQRRLSASVFGLWLVALGILVAFALTGA